MKKIYIIFSALLIVSCTKETIEKKIYKDLKNKNYTKIDLKKYTDFKWDTVYIFQKPTSLEKINSAIKKEYNDYEEFTRPIIFTKNGEIVYSENNGGNIEGIENGQLVYKDLLNEDDYIFKTFNNCIFPAKILKEDNTDYVVFK